jgi:hypothetical protein
MRIPGFGERAPQKNAAPVRDPAYLLRAVPRPGPGVDARDCDGVIQLRREAPPRARLLRWVVRRLRLDTGVRLVLDACGSRFWILLDGKNDLRRISEHLASHFSLERRDCEHAVLLYTKMLMRRHYLELMLPVPPPETEPAHE